MARIRKAATLASSLAKQHSQLLGKDKPVFVQTPARFSKDESRKIKRLLKSLGAADVKTAKRPNRSICRQCERGKAVALIVNEDLVLSEHPDFI